MEASKIKGQTVAYVRVSSSDQSADRQRESLAEFKPDKMFEDKISGKDTNRPALQEMIAYVRDGDLVLVHSLDRLARSLRDLCDLVTSLNKKRVSIHFIKEHLDFDADGNGRTATNDLLFHILGSFAEFERSLIRSRQREGIEIAKGEGKYKGRKRVLTSEQAGVARQRIAAGVSKAKIARDLQISRQTLYSYLKPEPGPVLAH